MRIQWRYLLWCCEAFVVDLDLVHFKEKSKEGNLIDLINDLRILYCTYWVLEGKVLSCKGLPIIWGCGDVWRVLVLLRECVVEKKISESLEVRILHTSWATRLNLFTDTLILAQSHEDLQSLIVRRWKASYHYQPYWWWAVPVEISQFHSDTMDRRNL